MKNSVINISTKTFFKVLVLYLSLILNNSVLFSQEQIDISKKLDQIAIKNLQKQHAHGLGYCIILPNDSIISGSAGIAYENIPINDTMQWLFASCTKTFIAALALQLQEEGKWSLDDKVYKYFSHTCIDSNTTIRHLLNHTSSITDKQGDKYFKAIMANPDSIWNPVDILNYYNTSPNNKKEGVFNYTNLNYLVLGILIEKLTGDSLDEVLVKRIFKKYGLNSTCFAPNNFTNNNFSGAWYDINGDSKLDDISKISLNSTLSLGFGAGNIVSTTIDMAKWTKLLYSGKVLNTESMKEMFTWANGSDRNKYFRGYGLGIDMLVLNEYENYGHTGYTIHASSMFYTPDLDLTMVIVTNEPSFVERDTKIEMFDFILEYLNKN